MIPMGCDFAYQNAKEEFENLERTISYVNAHNHANMQFRISTPSEFIEALKALPAKCMAYWIERLIQLI